MFKYLDSILTDANRPDVNVQLNTVTDFLGLALNITMALGLSLSVISLGIAGIKWVTAMGSADKAKIAGSALTYGVVALVITIAAFSAKVIIFGILDVTHVELVNEVPQF